MDATKPTRRRVQVYIERDVVMAFDRGSAAWTFHPDYWGRCGQGTDEFSALTDLRSQLGAGVELILAERITGDEQAFRRDYRPCTEAERNATAAILDACRHETLTLIESCSDAVLDWDDSSRVLPVFASWRTPRQLAWHIADTESRYYLPHAGLGYRPPAEDLLTELRDSLAHVRRIIRSMPADLNRTENGQVWTSVKLLRRLAWHERGELVVMRQLVRRAR